MAHVLGNLWKAFRRALRHFYMKNYWSSHLLHFHVFHSKSSTGAVCYSKAQPVVSATSTGELISTSLPYGQPARPSDLYRAQPHRKQAALPPQDRTNRTALGFPPNEVSKKGSEVITGSHVGIPPDRNNFKQFRSLEPP